MENPWGTFHGWPGISGISEMETERLFQKYRFSGNIFQNDQENPMGKFVGGREFPKYLKWKKRDFFKI